MKHLISTILIIGSTLSFGASASYVDDGEFLSFENIGLEVMKGKEFTNLRVTLEQMEASLVSEGLSDSGWRHASMSELHTIYGEVYGEIYTSGLENQPVKIEASASEGAEELYNKALDFYTDIGVGGIGSSGYIYPGLISSTKIGTNFSLGVNGFHSNNPYSLSYSMTASKDGVYGNSISNTFASTSVLYVLIRDIDDSTGASNVSAPITGAIALSLIAGAGALRRKLK